jgi:hypothetical protein
MLSDELIIRTSVLELKLFMSCLFVFMFSKYCNNFELSLLKTKATVFSQIM